MSKISELSDGGSLLPTDFLIAVRSGGNVKVQADQTEFDRIRLGDNEKIELGNSQDISIYWDGSVGKITNNIDVTGTVTATGILEASDGTNGEMQFGLGTALTTGAGTYDSSVRWNGSAGNLLFSQGAVEKMRITATGIDVTGTVTADVTRTSGANTNAFVLSDNVTGVQTSGFGTRIIGQSNSGSAISAIGFEADDGTNNDTAISFYTQPSAGSLRRRMKLGLSGDISFYEDTGTTPKLAWSASGETLTFADNGKAIFGAGSDLQIYHDGSASYVSDTGLGNLILRGNANVQIEGANGENCAIFNENGSVRLFHDNAEKLATTSTGIDVTGTVTADGLTVDGETTSSNGTYGTKLSYSDGNQSGIIDTFGNHNLEFRANNDRAMNIASNGDISFYEDTGTTPKFFWDASAESLGIGTSSLDANLTIDGFNTFPEMSFKASNQSSRKLTVGMDSSTEHYISAVGSETQLLFKTQDTERMRIDSSGHVIVPNGITLGTAAGTYAAANTLDDYEEGTFTPVMENVTGWSGSSGVDGNYTKIGDTVHVFISMTSNAALTGTPTNKITGLPFTPDLNERCSNVSVSRMFGIGLTTTDYIAGVSGTEIVFSYVNGDNNVNNLTHSGSTLRITLSATYTTAA